MPRKAKITAAPVEQPVEATETAQDGGEVSVETFQQICDRMANRLAEASKNLKEAQQDYKQLLRSHQREVKSARKNRRHSNTDASKKHNPSGFNKETPVPESLVKFLGLQSGVLMPRTKVTSALYSYIKENGLQNHVGANGQVDKRTIVPDVKLRTLFGLGPNETIEFKTFQTHVSKLYNAEKGKEEVAPAPAPVEAKPAVKASGKATKTAKTNA